MTGLNYVKMPRSVQEYTLMKGITDYSNLKQFDMFESGYSFLTVVSVPKFMEMLATNNTDLRTLQDGFVHILEGEFRGLSGIPDITADQGTITNGSNELQLINNVTMDTSIQVSMTVWERSGSLVTKYISYYLTGIKDPYSKAKTYHGLIGNIVNDPGPDWETFTFLYYVTDNTMRKVEKAYLLCNAQPTTAPTSTLYNSTRGTYDFQELDLSFNCFPIMGDTVNKYASMMLQNDLTTGVPERTLILDSNDYQFWAYKNRAEARNDDTGKSDVIGNRVGEILSSAELANIVDRKNRDGTHLGPSTKQATGSGFSDNTSGGASR